MKSLFPNSIFGHAREESQGSPRASTLSDEVPATQIGVPAMEEETTMLRTIGWITAGLGAVALGLVVGRELRQRYKFNRRTPYDYYAHSGDKMQDMEFGVGV